MRFFKEIKVRLLFSFLVVLQIVFSAAIPFILGFQEYWDWYIASVILISLFVSAFWVIKIEAGILDGAVIMGRDASELVRSNLSWLQPLMVVRQELVEKDGDTISNVMTDRYLSSIFLVLGLMGISVGWYIIWDPAVASRGLFGVILKFKIGQGVALSMCSYLAISSLSQYLVGVYFFFKGRL